MKSQPIIYTPNQALNPLYSGDPKTQTQIPYPKR